MDSNIHLVRTKASPLAPLFRSQTQQRVLATIFLESDRGWNMHELASRLGAPYASVHREVSRLLESGLLVEEKVGQARLFRPDQDAPAFRPLRDLLLVSFGAVPLLAQALHGIPGVDAAALYGSYAARLSGVSGPPPQDVDLLVIGRPDPLQVYAVVREVSRELNRQVNPTILDWDEWRADSGFLKEVRSNPLIPVLGDVQGREVQPGPVSRRDRHGDGSGTDSS